MGAAPTGAFILTSGSCRPGAAADDRAAGGSAPCWVHAFWITTARPVSAAVFSHPRCICMYNMHVCKECVCGIWENCFAGCSGEPGFWDLFLFFDLWGEYVEIIITGCYALVNFIIKKITFIKIISIYISLNDRGLNTIQYY